MLELGIIDEEEEEESSVSHVDTLLFIYRLCFTKYKMSFKDFMDDFIEDILDYMLFDLVKFPIEEDKEALEDLEDEE